MQADARKQKQFQLTRLTDRTSCLYVTPDGEVTMGRRDNRNKFQRWAKEEIRDEEEEEEEEQKADSKFTVRNIGNGEYLSFTLGVIAMQEEPYEWSSEKALIFPYGDNRKALAVDSNNPQLVVVKDFAPQDKTQMWKWNDVSPAPGKPAADCRPKPKSPAAAPAAAAAPAPSCSTTDCSPKLKEVNVKYQ